MYRIYKIHSHKSFIGFCLAKDDNLATNNNSHLFPWDMDFNDISINYKNSNYENSDGHITHEPYEGVVVRLYYDHSFRYYKLNTNYSRQILFELYDTELELIYEDEELSNNLLREKLPEYFY